ncbi:MAG: hypothetical protein WB780_09265 [Candidatus Acidiferrales bacterium]
MSPHELSDLNDGTRHELLAESNRGTKLSTQENFNDAQRPSRLNGFLAKIHAAHLMNTGWAACLAVAALLALSG